MQAEHKLSYSTNDQGIVLRVGEDELRVSPVTDQVFRVLYQPADNPSTEESLVVQTNRLGPPAWRLNETEDYLELTTAEVAARVSLQTAQVSFYNNRGELILKEQGRSITPAKVLGKETCHVEQHFVLEVDEGIYGLGQHQDGIMNYRGHDVRLVQENKTVSIPVMVSSKGYGIYWDNPSESQYHDHGETISLWSEVADKIDYYFIYGPTIDQVIAGYRELTGEAPLFPKWAFGLIQSKERYKTQDEILDVVKTYRERGIPVDCIVQDWRYWDPYQWGSHRFDPDRYPDPAGMIKELHEKYNCKFMISVWGRFAVGSENFHQLYKHGFLHKGFRFRDGEGMAYYDPFIKEAREMYWNQMNNWLFTKGVDGWWLDGTEPTFGKAWSVDERKVNFYGPMEDGAKYFNAYSLMTTRAVYEGQRKYTSEKRVYILTRSAFAGQQRYATTVWSGDITATWEVFRNQIPAGLNFCLTGIPYWTTDIGAFFVEYAGGNQNEEYRELFLRWFQFGVFCPIFRVHGTSTPREMWYFGEPGSTIYDTLLNFDRLRYRLLPYIYSLSWKVTHEHYTIMRALIFDFQEDEHVREIGDQFMFGNAFLVNPVLEPQAASRKVYLPVHEGGWFDFWTGAHLPGGETIEAATPLSIMPLYIKAGTILPLGPGGQHTEEAADPLELRIYQGQDAEFTLYEDEGDNYNYENGVYATIRFTWDEANETITIGAREGEFPGMLKERVFNIYWITPDSPCAYEAKTNPAQTIRYDGSQLVIKKN